MIVKFGRFVLIQLNIMTLKYDDNLKNLMGGLMRVDNKNERGRGGL